MGKRKLHHTPEPPKRKRGAPKGNQNAKGNKGGPGIPDGVKIALKHGLYSVGMHEEEKKLWPHMQMGNVEHEAKHARIMLRRACKAQLMWERQRGMFNEQVRQNVKAALGHATAAELFSLESMEIKEGMLAADMVVEGEEVPIAVPTPTSETKVVHKRTDYSTEIVKYTRLIIALEETQLKLMQEGSGEDYARQLAEDLRLFGDNAMGTMPGHGFAREV